MNETPLLNALDRDFAKSNKLEWKSAASRELNGSEPFIQLAWSDADNNKFFPYYDHEDVTNLDYVRKFFQPETNDSFLGPRRWFNLPCIPVSEEMSDNKIALDHLANGADGLLFEIHSDISFNKLLADVEPQYCFLSLILRNPQQLQSYLDYLNSRSQNFKSTEIKGMIFWKDIQSVQVNTQIGYNNIKSLGITVEKNTAANEIANALTLATQLIRKLADEKNLNDVVRNIAFSISVEGKIFHDVAKLRALRILWYQVVRAYGIANYRPSDLHIHAVSDSFSSEKYEPHGNMLTSTVAAMAGVIGGCDSISVLSSDSKNKMTERVARNVSNILREESYLNKVEDPLGGAYAIDSITNELAQSAWKFFQSKSK